MAEPVIGRISQIIGPVVDVSFDQKSVLPNIYDALEVTSDTGHVIVLECQQDIGESTIRTIAMDSTDGLHRGMKVVSKGQPISMPVGEDVKGRLFNVIGAPIDGLGPVSGKDTYAIHREPRSLKTLPPRARGYIPASR